MSFKKHAEKTIMVFDIVGSFFVDYFYNNLYIRANEISKSSGKSITTLYQQTICDFLRGLKSEVRFIHQIIKQIHVYYAQTTGINFVSLGDFQDKFLCEFFPVEYYADFDAKRKDTVLCNIITATVQRFSESLLSKSMYRRVIDDHKNAENIKLLQDDILNIFLDQKDDYYLRLAQECVKAPERAAFTDKKFKELKDAFIEEKRAKLQLEAENERLHNIVKALVTKLRDINSEQPTPKPLPKPILRAPKSDVDSSVTAALKRDLERAESDNAELRLKLAPKRPVIIAEEPAPKRVVYAPVESPPEIAEEPVQPRISQSTRDYFKNNANSIYEETESSSSTDEVLFAEI